MAISDMGIAQIREGLASKQFTACEVAQASLDRIAQADSQVHAFLEVTSEAAMAAAHYGLDSLCATVDRNGLQISGATEEVMGLEPLAERFRSFGWNAIEVPDGNDFEQLGAAYVLARNTKGRPSVVIARTVKGRGISFMEGRAKWHHGIPDESERRAAAQELATVMRDLK